jgi:hypothetical protein
MIVKIEFDHETDTVYTVCPAKAGNWILLVCELMDTLAGASVNLVHPATVSANKGTIKHENLYMAPIPSLFTLRYYMRVMEEEKKPLRFFAKQSCCCQR